MELQQSKWKGSEGTSELVLLMEFITTSPGAHIYSSNPYLDMEAKCTSTRRPSFQGNYGETDNLHVQIWCSCFAVCGNCSNHHFSKIVKTTSRQVPEQICIIFVSLQVVSRDQIFNPLLNCLDIRLCKCKFIIPYQIFRILSNTYKQSELC